MLGGGYDRRGDAWAIGCVVAEVLLGNALFVGSCEYNQLHVLFAAFGTPSESSWPGVSQLPDFARRAVVPYRAKSAEAVLPGLSSLARRLVLSLVVPDPAQRASPAQALRDEWFDEVRPLLEAPCLRAPAATNLVSSSTPESSPAWSRAASAPGPIRTPLRVRAAIESWRAATYRDAASTPGSDRTLALGMQLYDELVASRPLLADELDEPGNGNAFLACLYLASIPTLEETRLFNMLSARRHDADLRNLAREALLVHGPDLHVATSHDVLEALLLAPYGQATRDAARTLLQCSHYTLLGTVYGPGVVALTCLVLACSFAGEALAQHEALADLVDRDELATATEQLGSQLKELWIWVLPELGHGVLADARLSLTQRLACGRGGVDADDVLTRTPALASLLDLRPPEKDA
jgi:hypothetical protein